MREEREEREQRNGGKEKVLEYRKTRKNVNES
jgi:hypothetical protein